MDSGLSSSACNERSSVDVGTVAVAEQPEQPDSSVAKKKLRGKFATQVDAKETNFIKESRSHKGLHSKKLKNSYL